MRSRSAAIHLLLLAAAPWAAPPNALGGEPPVAPAPPAPAQDAQPPAPAEGPSTKPLGGLVGGLADGTRLWGSAYYLAVGADGSGTRRGRWDLAQEAGVTVNVRSVLGLELLGNFIFPIDEGQNADPRTVLQQLSVRASPMDRLTLIGGVQRLNWGTGKVFSAIDTLEPRPNPLQVRPLPPGVSGLKAVIIPSDRLSFTAVALPSSEPRFTKLAARADLVLEDAGLDLGLGVVRYTFTDRGAPGGPQKRSRPALVGDGAWSHGDLVLYEEVQLRRGRQAGYGFPGMGTFAALGGRDRWVFRGLCGATYQLDVGLTRPLLLLGEYAYNGDGLSRLEARTFAANLAAWEASGFPPGAVIPDLFGGIGGFRRHYLSVGVQNLALERYVLLGVNAIVGLDGLFSRWAASLEWDPTQGSAISVRYEYFKALASASREPTELILIPYQHRVTATFSASF